MFENHIVQKKGFRNVRKGGKLTGYEVQLRIPYYRGIPMSCVNQIKLTVDGEEVERKNMYCTVQGESFTMDQLTTAINHRWAMTEPITMFVFKDGGLEKGEHDVSAYVELRISYQPHPNTGADSKVLKLEEMELEV